MGLFSAWKLVFACCLLLLQLMIVCTKESLTIDVHHNNNSRSRMNCGPLLNVRSFSTVYIGIDDISRSNDCFCRIYYKTSNGNVKALITQSSPNTKNNVWTVIDTWTTANDPDRTSYYVFRGFTFTANDRLYDLTSHINNNIFLALNMAVDDGDYNETQMTCSNDDLSAQSSSAPDTELKTEIHIDATSTSVSESSSSNALLILSVVIILCVIVSITTVVVVLSCKLCCHRSLCNCSGCTKKPPPPITADTAVTFAPEHGNLYQYFDEDCPIGRVVYADIDHRSFLQVKTPEQVEDVSEHAGLTYADLDWNKYEQRQNGKEYNTTIEYEHVGHERGVYANVV